MSIMDKITNFFQKKAAQRISKEAAKAVGPKLVAKAKKDLVGTAEDALKDKLSDIAADMVEEEVDNNIQIPKKLEHMKKKIIDMAAEAAVDATYDEVKDAVLDK